MSGPVYAYRPSKAVTRRMVVETLARLGPVVPPSNYHYVGLGALEFIDFELVHRRLNITEMTSIESDVSHLARYESNRPYRGIRLLGGYAVDQLAGVSWSTHNAVWLDYECTLNTNEVLPSLRYLASTLHVGDFLAVTLNAHPAALEGRLARLTSAVGTELVPPGATDDTLGQWGLAACQRQVMDDVLQSEFRRDGRGHSWHQLLNLQYSDGARMQIVAGVIGTPALDQTLALCHFDDLDFYRPGPDVLVVEVPYLTDKERRSLNEALPRQPGVPLGLPGVEKAKVKAYADLYRWLEPTG